MNYLTEAWRKLKRLDEAPSPYAEGEPDEYIDIEGDILTHLDRLGHATSSIITLASILDTCTISKCYKNISNTGKVMGGKSSTDRQSDVSGLSENRISFEHNIGNAITKNNYEGNDKYICEVVFTKDAFKNFLKENPSAKLLPYNSPYERIAGHFNRDGSVKDKNASVPGLGIEAIYKIKDQDKFFIKFYSFDYKPLYLVEGIGAKTAWNRIYKIFNNLYNTNVFNGKLRKLSDLGEKAFNNNIKNNLEAYNIFPKDIDLENSYKWVADGAERSRIKLIGRNVKNSLLIYKGIRDSDSDILKKIKNAQTQWGDKAYEHAYIYFDWDLSYERAEELNKKKETKAYSNTAKAVTALNRSFSESEYVLILPIDDIRGQGFTFNRNDVMEIIIPSQYEDIIKFMHDYQHKVTDETKNIFNKLRSTDKETTNALCTLATNDWYSKISPLTSVILPEKIQKIITQMDNIIKSGTSDSQNV